MLEGIGSYTRELLEKVVNRDSAWTGGEGLERKESRERRECLGI
jgi:hypothetical protein